MKCGQLRISVLGDDEDTYIRAYMNGDPAGAMNLTEVYEQGDFVLAVTDAAVKPEYRRCGIGTKLYERAMKIACEQGLRIASDELRSDMSEGFWKKQLEKKRAKCIRGVGGRLPEGQWPCRRYVMREACPRKMDLSEWRPNR
jgi:GNAT superfamily N-acetyltransferase